jgi:hypothetical protein
MKNPLAQITGSSESDLSKSSLLYSAGYLVSEGIPRNGDGCNFPRQLGLELLAIPSASRTHWQSGSVDCYHYDLFGKRPAKWSSTYHVPTFLPPLESVWKAIQFFLANILIPFRSLQCIWGENAIHLFGSTCHRFREVGKMTHLFCSVDLDVTLNRSA